MPSAGGHPTLIRGWNPLGEIDRQTERDTSYNREQQQQQKEETESGEAQRHRSTGA